MLIKSVFLGLVLASIVLALPTRNEENNRNEISDVESRRELLNKDEQRRSMKVDNLQEEKKDERRGVDKKESRRGVDKKEEEEKDERRRELNKEEEKKENRRRGTETFKEERKMDERRGVDKMDERRDVDKKEEEEKKEERRGVDKKEEEEKKEERRGVDKKEEEEKKEERRGVDKNEEEEKKEERRETEEKKDERRGVDKKEEEEKKDERRGVDKMDERRGVDKMDERRGVDKMEEEEKKDERRETEQREKRRPTPAIKEERRNIDRDEEKKVERELNNRKLTIEKRESKQSSLTICESVTDFKYFQKYESDPSKYIQCDPWGTGKVKSCSEGLLWNEWTLKCDAKDHIRNMTLDLSKFSVTTAARPILNCSIIGMDCRNGGSCIESASGLFKCACRSDFTGQHCETRVDLTDITHEILNSTFSVTEYRHRLHEENITLGLHYYERYKDQLDNQTYSELINYLKLYPNGEVRYDTLVNNIVEDILENIYPDAGYLSAFNASEQSVVTMVQMVPSLLSYSRYSFERYEDVFAQYQQVLVSLAKLLNNTIPTIQKEATQYTVLTHIFLNQTLALLNNTVDKNLFTENANVEKPIQLSENDIKKALQVNYNATLKATEQILQILEVFQSSIVKELETNPSSVVNATLGQAKFAGAKEMLEVLNQVSIASTQIWESLINYGFWYLTNLFSASSKIDSLQRFSFNLNKF